MTVQKITVAPGAELSVIPTDKFKSSYFALNFYIPLEKERASRVSLLSRVMTRGTADHPTIGELNKFTDMLYELNFSMSVSAVGGVQTLCFRMDYLGDRFTPASEKESVADGAMNFLREFFLRPLVKDGAFSKDYTEAEKKLLTDRIKSEINNKDAYALKRARRQFLGDHPASISTMGEIEYVSALDGAKLYREFKTVLREAHAEALLVGDVSGGVVDKAVEALRDILPADRADTEMPYIPRPNFDNISAETRDIVEEVNARQGRMVLGYSLPYDGTESAVATTFVEIFSGSPISRLFVNVRERLNLCYYCSAGVDASIGAMLIRSGIAEENVETAQAEIVRQLQDIVSGNVSENELEVAKTAILSSMKGLKESSTALGEWYLRRIAMRLPSDIDVMMKRAEGVTVAEIAELASRAKLRMRYFLRGVSVDTAVGKDCE